MSIEIENLPPHYAHILRLWEANVTGGNIAKEVGKTRSAVMSIIRKMRLMGFVTRNAETDRLRKVIHDAATGEVTVHLRDKKGRFASNNVSPIINIPFYTIEANRKPPKDVKHAEVRGDEIYIENLSLFTCRYINGEVDGANTLYCGHRVTRGVYCHEHAELCYVPLHKRYI